MRVKDYKESHLLGEFVCVCVCVREREREREMEDLAGETG